MIRLIKILILAPRDSCSNQSLFSMGEIFIILISLAFTHGGRMLCPVGIPQRFGCLSGDRGYSTLTCHPDCTTLDNNQCGNQSVSEGRSGVKRSLVGNPYRVHGNAVSQVIACESEEDTELQTQRKGFWLPARSLLARSLLSSLHMGTGIRTAH